MFIQTKVATTKSCTDRTKATLGPILVWPTTYHVNGSRQFDPSPTTHNPNPFIRFYSLFKYGTHSVPPFISLFPLCSIFCSPRQSGIPKSSFFLRNSKTSLGFFLRYGSCSFSIVLGLKTLNN